MAFLLYAYTISTDCSTENGYVRAWSIEEAERKVTARAGGHPFTVGLATPDDDTVNEFHTEEVHYGK